MTVQSGQRRWSKVTEECKIDIRDVREGDYLNKYFLQIPSSPQKVEDGASGQSTAQSWQSRRELAPPISRETLPRLLNRLHPQTINCSNYNNPGV